MHIIENPDSVKELFHETMTQLTKGNLQPFAQLELMYKFSDAFGQAVQEKTVCKKGCSFCCSIPVQVTSIEAYYIAKMTNTKLNKNKNYDTTDMQCPLLLNDLCSVYKYRPLECRTFFSLDSVDFCKILDIPHKTIQTSTTKMKHFYKFLDKLSKPEKINDLRYYFAKKLS